MAVAVPFSSAPRSEPDIEKLVRLVRADMESVNTLILSMAGSDVQMIPEVANHLISSGGKRLRPMLTLAAARACGYAGEGHVKLAASVEFMHTATLLHDDVVDESEMRRGKQAARMLWGNQASVLVGDYLLGQAFRMMVEVGSLIALGILSTAASVIAEGEVMQLAAAKKLETTEADYMAVVNAKTAALFAAAAEVGPVIAGSDDTLRTAFRDYGLALGLAFQLVDDALDYGGDSGQLGKNVGDDFREGKITLPILVALKAATPEERAFWSRCLVEGKIADGDLETALGILRRHGAIAATVTRAKDFGARAIAALDPLPDSEWKQALVDVVGFCIARVH